MRANSSYDLFQLVPDAESIEFRSGRTRLAGSSLSQRRFHGWDGGRSLQHFTARKGSRSSHIEMNIDVVQQIADISPVEPFPVSCRDRRERRDRGFSESAECVRDAGSRVNQRVPSERGIPVSLRNSDKKYNNETAGNFWATHGLNPCGFQNGVKIYTEHFDGSNGNWVENLLFSGLILETFAAVP